MNRLRDLREKKGVSLREVANSDKVSVSAVQLGKYENWKAEPRASIRQELADYYGVSVAYLMGHDEQRELNNLDEVKEALKQVIEVTRARVKKTDDKRLTPEEQNSLIQLRSLEQYLLLIDKINLNGKVDEKGINLDAHYFSDHTDEYFTFHSACLEDEKISGVHPEKHIDKMNRLAQQHLEKTEEKWSK